MTAVSRLSKLWATLSIIAVVDSQNFVPISISVGSDQWWVADSPDNKITWECDVSQVSSFSIVLQNENTSVLREQRPLFANISNSQCSITVPSTSATLPVASGYSVLFTGVLDSDSDTEGASPTSRSDIFEVKPVSPSLPSTSASRKVTSDVIPVPKTITFLNLTFVPSLPSFATPTPKSISSIAPTFNSTASSSSSVEKMLTFTSITTVSGSTQTDSSDPSSHPFMNDPVAITGTFTVVGLIISVIAIVMARAIRARRRIHTQHVHGQGTLEIDPFPHPSTPVTILPQREPPGYVESLPSYRPQEDIVRSSTVEIKAQT
ncbi:hypothetical protein SCHPADRAFT_55119 [Schizopora paradoxa]|uniref:Mid2 domain-containing protein n=1 Tax=Schizopora paradoxa TaxID=27342 RepID=A0A0H2S5Z7_9AGAM|nr:hypothetical protein SCHPADRAFT_55119 [Schizopora paradoxa]